jgi:hypothetical protein
MLRYTIWLLLLIFPVSLAGQSTSPWKRIGNASFGDVQNPSPGAAYMTLFLRAATVYQKSNWWTNFVEKNRQAVLTLNLDGNFANTHVSRTIVGDPITLQKDDSLVDLGFSGIVIDHLPTTFTSVTFNVQINKTAHDGLNDLISMVSNLSQTQPPVLSVSQQAVGVINLSKSLADYLFNKNLLVKKVNSRSPIPASGILAPGIYVCLAGDSVSDYEHFLAGRHDLKWDGTTLTSDDTPVQKISYFVIEVGYSSKFFAEPLDSLSFGAVKPWAALYLVAESEVPNISDAASEQKIHDDIQSHLNDARTLLSGDQDYIEGERESIAAAVHDKIQAAVDSRLRLLGLVQAASQPSQPGGRVSFISATPDQLRQQHDLLDRIRLSNRLMQPTVARPQ